MLSSEMQPEIQTQNHSNFHSSSEQSLANFLFKNLMLGDFGSIMDQKTLHMWTAIKISIGNLIVKGYRVLKFILERQCIIFIKKEGLDSKYLYFKIAINNSFIMPPNFFTGVKLCIDEVNAMRRKTKQNYSLLIIFAHTHDTLEISSCKELTNIFQSNLNHTKKDLLNKINEQNRTCETFTIPYKFKEDLTIGGNDEQRKKLLQVLYSYLDTFGQKFKTNFYKDLTTKSLYLINTFNCIIFDQSFSQKHKNKYNQIESACWTQFYGGKMEYDRKDIFIQGNQCILILDLMFNQNFNYYINQAYEEQVNNLMIECQKAYKQAKLKVIRIGNILNASNIYSYQRKTVSGFP